MAEVYLEGHFSNNKSFGTVAARFYWPGLYLDLLASCKSCMESQLNPDGKPIHLGIPKPFPSAKLDTPHLSQLFSRLGIPQEVLTDQGTEVISKTLRQVYGLLGIKGIRTTPYHPQTDG